MGETHFGLFHELFGAEPQCKVGGGVFVSGDDMWDGLSSDEAELQVHGPSREDVPPCDVERRKLCEEFGCDGYGDEGYDRFGDSHEGYGTPSLEAIEDGHRFAEDFLARIAPHMERMLSVPPEKVIFSGPATIAIWPSGDKVVAKCSGNDVYDREKGLMMCLLKKNYGSKAVDVLEEWCR